VRTFPPLKHELRYAQRTLRLFLGNALPRAGAYFTQDKRQIVDFVRAELVEA